MLRDTATSHLDPLPAANCVYFTDAAVGIVRSTAYLRLKHGFDAAAALSLLVLTAPLILLAAALVKLTSRGPAFYTQRRVGRNGRPYTIFKIRTMLHNCERLTGPRWATKRDPRTIPVGRFLRWTHVDELPQLWNVLRGDMSIVGPRPERPEFVAQLERGIPYYCDRLQVRPGLTGLSQVQLPADSGVQSVRRKAAYDLYYVRELNFWLDLKILLSTVFYLAGVPFAVPRRLFGVPSGEAVERPYESLAEAFEPVPSLQAS